MKMFKNDLVYRTTPVAALKHLVKYFIDPFVPNAPFLYPLKTSENLLISFDTPWKHQKTSDFLIFLGAIKKDQWVFWCFQEIEKGCILNEWVKNEMLKIFKNLTGKNIDSNYKLPTQSSENFLKNKIFSEYGKFLWLL